MSFRRLSLRITPDALSDLSDIDLHSLIQCGEDVARARHDRIMSAFEHLRSFRELGVSRPELGVDIRSFAIPPHVVLYVVQGSELVVLRIVHERLGLASFD